MREKEDFEKCNYWIEAPKGTRIEVKIDRISGSYAVDGCPYFGVEIKSQIDQRATGYRFCAREDAGVTLMSYSNRVPVIIYSREGRTDLKLKYRYASNGKPGPKPEFTTTAPVTATRTRTRVTTYPPRPPVVTTKPFPVTDGFFCVDNPKYRLRHAETNEILFFTSVPSTYEDSPLPKNVRNDGTESDQKNIEINTSSSQSRLVRFCARLERAHT
ncbi:hypothetical protein ANCDUO_27549 [Ancylostoma duodenale]|uniref:CUB domain-containing protein n=1 Tax=Ancylostoma duodenale TaxID=51022 RepID=A0A0C2FBP1_9BILA|nr:hypothetical protein ANCDUO_27549 [Ancylostoma duodenale]